MCTEYAERNNYTVIDEYKDYALTGTNDKRPALQKLLRDCSKKLFEMVIVYAIDRFGQDLRQSLENADKIEKENNILLVSATENFTPDPSGRFFRNFMMAYAQYYSEELSVKIKRGMDYNAENFLCTGGNIALGYKVDENKHFQIDSETTPIVKSVFEMYADGKNVTEITKQLNAEGCKTSRGVAFNKNSLRTMLQNKRYIGIYTYKGHEFPNKMPRIISDELFNKVTDIMNKNRKAPARHKAKVEYLLTTKLFCGSCKEMMTGFSGTAKSQKVYRYYICNGSKKKQCSKKIIGKDYIEDLVIHECRKILTGKNIQKIAAEIVAICELEKDTANLKRLKKMLADNERKHRNAMDAILDCDEESIRKNLYAVIPKLESEQEELKKQIAIEGAKTPVLTVDGIAFFLNGLKKGNINDMKYRKTLISVFVNRIYLYDDRMTIIFNSGDEPVTLTDLLLSEIETEHKQNEFCLCSGVVEPVGIEPTSENLSMQLSSGTVSLLCFPPSPPADGMRRSVSF